MPPGHPTNREIKSLVVERLKENPHTQGYDIRVDVKRAVVVLGGEVSSWLAKRAAGDDAWTPREWLTSATN
ncbi:BON domain-containing protein [Kribbella sp. NPDC026611]|uniref:BON domain-containing protein n=1 Tax=Kribbella sp. NPDC026611 TaxID=3154911 RepID=UPI0033E589E4